MSNEGLISGMKMQVTTQDNQQIDGRAKSQFRRGQSGNPSGKTLTLAVHGSLLDHFRQVHGREPGVVEALNLRTASKLVAKAQAPGVNAEQATRCANTVSRLLVSLGLHSRTPPRPGAKPARSLPTIRDYAASKVSSP